MEENFFSLHQKHHLSNVSVTMKNSDVCAMTIQKARIVKRKAIEHEIRFYSGGQRYVVNFKANKKHLSVRNSYPLRGVRSCIEHDGTMIQKLRMGYFNDQELRLSKSGEMMLSFLLNDIINTVQLMRKNPGIIVEYYYFIRKRLEEISQNQLEEKINHHHIKKSSYAHWLSDSIRKKHFFSYNGVNMFLSFQAIVQNHPELFNTELN